MAHIETKLLTRMDRCPPARSSLHTPLPPAPSHTALCIPPQRAQVAHIETEWLLIKMVAAEMARRKARGQFGGKFAALSHYFG